MFEQSGFTFLVDKELMKSAAPIKVDLTYAGFTVSSSLKLGGGGCSGGSCSSC